MKRFVALFLALAAVAAIPASRAQGMGDMKDMNTGKKSQTQTHKASGTVTKLDAATGKVTIAHGAIPTLKWSAMTMTFVVKDKALLDKLSSGKNIEFEFTQQGQDYVITSAK